MTTKKAMLVLNRFDKACDIMRKIDKEYIEICNDMAYQRRFHVYKTEDFLDMYYALKDLPECGDLFKYKGTKVFDVQINGHIIEVII